MEKEQFNFYTDSYKYYFGSDGNTTYVKGLLKQNFKFNKQFSKKELMHLDFTLTFLSYATFLMTTLLFIYYLYGVFFKNYLALSELPSVIFALVLSLPVILIITGCYFVMDKIFNKYLSTFGNFTKQEKEFKVPFNISEKNIVGAKFMKVRFFIELIFCFIIISTITIFGVLLSNSEKIILNLIEQGDYQKANNIATFAENLTPVSSMNIALTAITEVYLKDYDSAIEHFKLANNYSKNQIYNDDIVLVKQLYLEPEEMLKNYDEAIFNAPRNIDKYFLMYSKANYLYNLKDYKNALVNYNILIKAFKISEALSIRPETIYYKRGLTYRKLNDNNNSNSDIQMAKFYCPECDFSNLDVDKFNLEMNFEY
ncbi:MAG: hypothetical protein R3Y28_06700 [Candidatus Gastranaerophilales bacterium]